MKSTANLHLCMARVLVQAANGVQPDTRRQRDSRLWLCGNDRPPVSSAPKGNVVKGSLFEYLPFPGALPRADMLRPLRDNCTRPPNTNDTAKHRHPRHLGGTTRTLPRAPPGLRDSWQRSECPGKRRPGHLKTRPGNPLPHKNCIRLKSSAVGIIMCVVRRCVPIEAAPHETGTTALLFFYLSGVRHDWSIL